MLIPPPIAAENGAQAIISPSWEVGAVPEGKDCPTPRIPTKERCLDTTNEYASLVADPAVIRQFFAETLRDDIHLFSVAPDANDEDHHLRAGKYFGGDVDAAVTWVVQKNVAGWNVWHTLNRVKADFNGKKPKKEHIKGARVLHADIDPPKDGSLWDKGATVAELMALLTPPSYVIDTGNGLCPVWRLDQDIDNCAAVETVNIAIRHKFKADACHNIERVTGIPGTVNYPGKVKRDRGMKPIMRGWAVEDDGIFYEFHDLAMAFPTVADGSSGNDNAEVTRGSVALPSSILLLTTDDLHLETLSPIRSVIDHPVGKDRSTDTLRCAGDMMRAGFTPEQVAGVLLNPANRVAKHCLEAADPRRAALRAIDVVYGNSHASGVSHPASTPRLPTPANDIGPLAYEWAGDRQPDLSGFWLIKKFLPAEGLALIYGHPGSAKTFFALDMAFAVALGRPWRGKAVQQGLVVYVAAEGANGIRQRVEAFKRANGLTERLPIAIIPTPIDMQAANADTKRLAETIRHAAEASGMKPALVIVDTISKTFGAGKENTDDMATYVANCGHIAAEFSCCVMPVHHRPKDAESKDPRGHSSLRGGCDTIILTEGSKIRKATVTKQKDGEDGETFTFDLLQVELGFDDDGEAVNSCVVREISAALSPVTDPQTAAFNKLSSGQKITLEALGLALEDEGQLVPECIPANVINRLLVGKVVSIDAWNRLFLATSAIDRTDPGQSRDDGAGQMPDRLPDTLRKTFSRHRQSLQTKGFVGVWEQYAWLAH